VVNIFGVYGHYKWLYNLSLKNSDGPKTGAKASPQYDGTTTNGRRGTIGFKGQKHKAHEKRPSTEWPVQRYVWSDYFIDDGDQVAYRAIPMIGRPTI
jgi:hypothetical protein